MNETNMKKLEQIYELFLILDDSINYCWNEGCEGYYQISLSKIIKDKFTDLLKQTNENYIEYK